MRVSGIESGTGVPPLSVLLSVYNDQEHIAEAIASILGQSFEDFEFVVVDDGSTDRTPQILRAAAAEDRRLRVLRRERRNGYTRALEQGLKHCRAPWIARMDSDDASHPQRFERQLEHLRTHPEVVLVGTGAERMDARGRRHPVAPQVQRGWSGGHEALLGNLLEGRCCFANPTVMFHRETFDRAGGYDPAFEPAEDYELFLRLARAGRIGCVPEVLGFYRTREGGVTRTRLQEQLICVHHAILEHWAVTGAPPKADLRRALQRQKDQVQDLDHWAVSAKDARLHAALERLAGADCRRVGVYGAGMHTRSCPRSFEHPAVCLVCVIDDGDFSAATLWGRPIVPVVEALRLKLDAVVLSSDTVEDRLWAAAEPLREAGVRVERLYDATQAA